MKDLALILFGVCLFALSAQITIHIPTAVQIPITGQSLAILSFSMLVRPRIAISAILSYLILALMGLPVLADGESGLSKFTGGSGGFLIGFLIAGVMVSNLTKNKDSLGHLLLISSLGTTVLLTCGVLFLTYLYGFNDAIAYGFTPFWQGAIIKIILGAILVFVINKFLIKKTNQLI